MTEPENNGPCYGDDHENPFYDHPGEANSWDDHGQSDEERTIYWTHGNPWLPLPDCRCGSCLVERKIRHETTEALVRVIDDEFYQRWAKSTREELKKKLTDTEQTGGVRMTEPKSTGEVFIDGQLAGHGDIPWQLPEDEWARPAKHNILSDDFVCDLASAYLYLLRCQDETTPYEYPTLCGIFNSEGKARGAAENVTGEPLDWTPSLDGTSSWAHIHKGGVWTTTFFIDKFEPNQYYEGDR